MRFMKSSKSLSLLCMGILASSCINNSPTITQAPTTNQNPVSTSNQAQDNTLNNTSTNEIPEYKGFKGENQITDLSNESQDEDKDGLGGGSSCSHLYEGVIFKGQCVPAARKYIKVKYNYSLPLLGEYGGAYLLWNEKKPDSSKMQRIEYTGSNLPQKDDVIIYKPWGKNKYGHVAIVGSVNGKDKTELVESNWYPYECGGTHVMKDSEWKLVYGWYRPIQNKNNSVNQNPIIQQPVIQEPTQVIQKQNKSPIINSIDINPTNAEVSIGGKQIVTLKSNVSDPDGDNLTYEWWFNNVPQRYNQNDSIELGKGTHVIKFQVRDGNGGIAIQEKTVVITEKQVAIPLPPEVFSPLNLNKSTSLTNITFSDLSKLEANSFSGYGEFDGKSDIIYDKQYGEWSFNTQITQGIIRIKGALWDGATSSYTNNFKIKVFVNNKVVYDGRSPFEQSNIVNYNNNLNLANWNTITNWKTLDIPVSNLSNLNSLILVNNNGGSVWTAIDSIELLK